MIAPTLVTCLTPPGSGAVATVALQGAGAWELLRALFEPRGRTPLPEQPEPGPRSRGTRLERGRSQLKCAASGGAKRRTVHAHHIQLARPGVGKSLVIVAITLGNLRAQCPSDRPLSRHRSLAAPASLDAAYARA